MSWARVLLVADCPLGDASWGRRVADSLERAGHAVFELSPAEAARDDVLARAAASFGPSIVLWDGACGLPGDAAAEALAGMSCLRALLVHETLGGGVKGALATEDADASGAFDCEVRVGPGGGGAQGDVLAVTCRADAPYERAKRADSTLVRAGVSTTVPATSAAAEAVRDALENAAAARFVATCASWGERALLAGQTPAFHLRTTAECYVDAATTWADAALRVAEGNAVRCVGEPVDVDVSGLPSLDEDLPRVLAALDGRAREAGRPAVLACDEPAAIVVLYGWLGMRNFGDDLLMRTVWMRVRQRFGNAVVRVFAGDPGRVLGDHGLQAARTGDKPTASRWLSRACALVYLGGLVFDEPLAGTAGGTEFLLDADMEPNCQAGIALLAASLGTPPVMLGIGAGPVRDAATMQAVRLLGLAGTRVIARDGGTAEIFERCGVPPAQVMRAADLVFGAREQLLAMAQVAEEAGAVPGLPERFFVVSLREWPGNPPDFEQRVARAVRLASEQLEAAAVFLPLDEADRGIHARVCALAGLPGAVRVDERLGEEAMAAVMARSAGALAMRLHCSVVHHVLGKPACGLDYNDKVGEHFRALGQEAALVGLDAPADAMAAALVASVARFDGARLAEAVQWRARLVERAYDQLWEAAASAQAARAAAGEPQIAYYPRTVSRAELALQQRDRDLARAVRERDDAQAEARELRESTSFKLGHAVVAPAAKLLRR